MIRWIAFALLSVATVATAIGVVTMRHEARQMFTSLQQAEAQRDEARMEWSRLQLEQAWLADAGRVERQARDELDMRVPDRIQLLVERR